MMLKYKEVYKNLVFEIIPTIPLELRAVIQKAGINRENRHYKSPYGIDFGLVAYQVIQLKKITN